VHSSELPENHLFRQERQGETHTPRVILGQLVADSTNQESVQIQFLFTITPVLNSFHDVNLCIMCQLLSKMVLISGVVWQFVLTFFKPGLLDKASEKFSRRMVTLNTYFIQYLFTECLASLFSSFLCSVMTLFMLGYLQLLRELLLERLLQILL
jgi:hypothetical protein